MCINFWHCQASHLDHYKRNIYTIINAYIRHTNKYVYGLIILLFVLTEVYFMNKVT